MSSETTTVLFLAAAVVLLAGWAFYQLRRARRLRETFGPEYDRLLGREGSARRAAAVLDQRRRRVAELRPRSLRQEERDRFAAEWRRLQEHFVDDPPDAVARAAAVVGQGLQARGYPLGDFEPQTADLSVQHPKAVEHDRRAHEIAATARHGLAATEDLRRAMQHYRTVIEELLDTSMVEPREHEEVHRGLAARR
jgi:hypothetical protein